MKLIFLAFCLLSSQVYSAHAQQLDWARQIGGLNYDQGLDIAVDGSRNVYTVGGFQGLADFDPGPSTFTLSSAGSSDGFVVKTDAAGSFLWARRMGGPGIDEVWGIALDVNGNVYLTGTFEGTADFGPSSPTLVSAGYGDIFVMKLDPAGNVLWVKGIGGTGRESGRDIKIGGNGVYTLATFQDTLDADPGPNVSSVTSTGAGDILVSKFDLDGNFVWAGSFGGPNYDEYPSEIALDAANNVYIGGSFFDTGDFDPGPGVWSMTSAGSLDVFLLKLTSAGTLLWARQIGGSGGDWNTSIAVDGANNVYAAGKFKGNADFDPGPGMFKIDAKTDDVFVVKLNGGGSFLWVRKMDGAFLESITDIEVDASGVYVAGNFAVEIDVDPGPAKFELRGVNGREIFLTKLQNNGDFAWARHIGGPRDEEVYALARDSDGSLYITGSFKGPTDFDPGPGVYELTIVGNAQVDGDIFVAKYEPVPASCFLSCSASVQAAAKAGSTVSFGGSVSASDCVAPIDYSWNFGDGTPGSAEQIASHAYQNKGVYNWSLEVSSAEQLCLKSGKIDVVEAVEPVLPRITEPVGPLTGSTQRFSWTAGAGVDQYRLSLGTNPAADNLFNQILGTQRSVVVSGLPTDGRVIYGRLGALISGEWRTVNLQFNAALLICNLSCTATAPESSKAGSTALFQAAALPLNCASPPSYSWKFGDGGTSTQQNPSYAYQRGGSFNWSVEVSADQKSCIRSGTISVHESVTPAPATILAPVPGSTLSGASQQFDWSKGVGVSGYRLRIGSSLGASDIYFDSFESQTSATVPDLPTDGRTLYVQLESLIGGEWLLTSEQYRAAKKIAVPAISIGGIVSASLTPKVETISPGSIFSVFGENFSPQTILHPTLTGSGELSRILGGVCLEMNDERLPLFAVTPNQINAQVSHSQGLGPANFRVVTNCGGPLSQAVSSEAKTVMIGEATPSFFLFPPLSDGGFIAARFNATETQPPVPVAPASLFPNDAFGSSRPAAPGDIIVLYGTGWGPTEAGRPAGQLATAAARLLPEANPSVSFGGLVLSPDDVLYVGLTPGAAGLYQLAIRVPSAAQAGNNQVVLTVYGNSTPAGPVVPVVLP